MTGLGASLIESIRVITGWKEWKAGKRAYVKIIVTAVLMAVIPMLIIESVSDIFLVRTMKSAQISFLQSTSRVVCQYIDDTFQDQKRNSLFLTNSSPIRSFLRTEYAGEKEKMEWWSGQVQDMLQNSVAYENNTLCVRLVDRNGQVVASSDSQQVGMDLSKTQMYRSMMKGDPQYTEILVDRSGNRSLKLVFPVVSQGQINGFLEKTINFQGMEACMEHKKTEDRGYLYLIDTGQESLYHRQRDCLILPDGQCNNEFEMKSLIRIVSKSTKQKTGVIRYELCGRTTTAVYEKIPSLNWIVVSAVDETAFTKAVWAFNLIVIAVGILIGGVAAWMGYGFARRRLQRYQILSNAFASISGDSKIVENMEIADLPELLNYVNQAEERVRTIQSRVRLLEGSDCLTGLHNRLGLERFFAEELSGKKAPMAALLLNLDSIAFWDERKEAGLGAAAIGELGRAIRGCMGSACAIGRMENEEFMIFYYDWREGANPMELAEQLRLHVEDLIFSEQKRAFVTVSIGLYFTEKEDGFYEIYERCMDALIQARQSDQSRIVVYRGLPQSDRADGF